MIIPSCAKAWLPASRWKATCWSAAWRPPPSTPSIWWRKLNPDIVVTDLSLSGKPGLELIKDIRAARPTLPILVLSIHDEELWAERVLRAGARVMS